MAVIGNCQVAGLLDAAGQLVWACLPRPDSDPTFCALLTNDDAENARGLFAVEMIDCERQVQNYRRNTAVVETRLTDTRGNVVRMIDFCPRFRQGGRMFRPASFVRLVEPLEGKPQVRLIFRPAIGYGSDRPRMAAGSHYLRFSLAEMDCRITTNASLTALTEPLPFVLGGALAFIIGPDQGADQETLLLAQAWQHQTEEYWQEWVRTLAIPFDWQEAVIRAAITLKLCTYEDTGAVLAALTTSVPEAAGTERNWDYRFCWLRDSFFVIQALNRLGATRTMEGYLRYINNIITHSSGGLLQPLYGITGNHALEESLVDSLPGFRGMGPVRIGNAAATQRQHDVYGAVILAASQFFYDARLAALGDLHLFQQLEMLGAHAAELFEEADAGPWEYRGIVHKHTFSAVMCWAGCDRLARISAHLGQSKRVAHWRRLADAMRERILQAAWNPARQAIVDRFGGQDVDATALLLPELGFLPASDPRFIATLAAVERDLRDGDLIFRYRHRDDFGVPHNAFTVCSFWYVNALAAAGRIDEARASFERLLQRRNRLGMLSEDIDPGSGAHWGNYPQTYSMVGIITSALRLSRSWEDVV
jgi:GH15 family glucan-1,4-alpha-glucosidase